MCVFPSSVLSGQLPGVLTPGFSGLLFLGGHARRLLSQMILL